MRINLVIAIICTRYGVVVVVWIIRGPLYRGASHVLPAPIVITTLLQWQIINNIFANKAYLRTNNDQPEPCLDYFCLASPASRCFFHLTATAFLAISDLRSGLSRSALAGPPFSPPRLPSARAAFSI